MFYQPAMALIAQLEERQTEDLKVPGSIPGQGIIFAISHLFTLFCQANRTVAQDAASVKIPSC
jgi:hypothetical protein